MRNYIALLVSLVFLTACGGGSSSMPPPIPFGSVSGTAFDGLILNGTVSVYDFTTGAKGALLGQATTDSSSGLYSLSLQVESRPVLVEVTGGYYIEEAGANAQIALDTAPNTMHKLTALANYTTGAALKVAATTYTHLAAGLAVYQISKGTAVATAINNANTRASSLAGVNILTTTPRQITDVGNASATLTPELKYGFLAGAVSMWTLNNTPNTAIARTQPYTSIDFAQLLYQDVSADGLLDGIGLDSTGVAAPLSFGVTPLGVDVYRKGLGISLVQMAAHPNNKTGIDAPHVLSFAQNYVGNTDAMFSNVAPNPISDPVVTITSNAWVNKPSNVVAAIQDVFGIRSTDFIVGNATVATSASNNPAQTFQFDTSKYSEGVHNVSIHVINLAGQTTTTTIPIGIDFTAPASTVGGLPTLRLSLSGAQVLSVPVNGCASDGGSGVLSVTSLSTSTIVSTDPATGCWSVPNVTFQITTNLNAYQFLIKDRANNCSIYNAIPAVFDMRGNNQANPYIARPSGWTIVSSGACQ